MSYWVLHREQVSLELNMEMFSTQEEAWTKRCKLQQEYHDVIVLSEDDYNKLGDKVFKHKISNINRNNGGEDNTEHSEHYYDTERNK